LNMKGGSARPVIPFLKKTGFLASDGSPTELYERFRNEQQSGAAAAEALRIGFSGLYAVNEYVHDASDSEIKGIIVQVTGTEKDSSTVGAVLGSFKALRAFADFEAVAPIQEAAKDTGDEEVARVAARIPGGLNL